MRVLSSLALLVALVGAGCGARTGNDGDPGSDHGTSGPGTSDASSARGTAGPQNGVFCAFHVGLVPSCDAPASDGPVQRCGPHFHCVNVSGQWGCCSADSNNNGAGGTCSFPGEVPFCE
jgi:hypothetical protein